MFTAAVSATSSDSFLVLISVLNIQRSYKSNTLPGVVKYDYWASSVGRHEFHTNKTLAVVLHWKYLF